jgi:hypothetical protein
MFATIFILILGIVLLFGKPAYAYLDIGTGSYFLQVCIAGLLGFLVALKLYWKKIIGIVSGIFRKNGKNQ